MPKWKPEHRECRMRNGVEVNLSKMCDDTWRIVMCEASGMVRPSMAEVVEGISSAGSGAHITHVGFGMVTRDYMNAKWAEMRFDSSDDALKFVADQLHTHAA